MTTGVIEGRETPVRLVVAISGSSGLIGSAIARRVERTGGEVRRLVRRPAHAPGEISWNPERGFIDSAALDGVDAVINLAGENLAQRWTDEAKRRIRDSRVRSTKLLSKTVATLARKPRAFLSGSAIGIYGNRGDEILDESSSLGDDFLASVCKDWEAAAEPAMDAGVRLVHLRTGIVLSRDGGALPKILLPFKLGVGGRLGSGRQWMSWIALADYVDAIAFLLANETIHGPVNMVSINPATNDEFAHTVARVLGRPAIVPVPGFAMKLMLGEMAEDTVLASQRVAPRRLVDAGFGFNHPTLESALRAEIGKNVA
jgi:uncharacterized protein (TIGR01777 family)